jgi:hypothetical protein
VILASLLSGLLIGFGAVAGLEPEVGEPVLFVIVMCASFYGFAAWLEDLSKSRHTDIRKASLADYRWVRHG